MSSFINKKYNLKIYDLIIFFPIISFAIGFYLNENSAGAGGFNGDFSWIKKNIEIFEKNNLIDAILHSDFFGNRSPLIYIINKFLNPFFFLILKNIDISALFFLF